MVWNGWFSSDKLNSKSLPFIQVCSADIASSIQVQATHLLSGDKSVSS
jgi:hypothetical protein